LNIMEVYKKGSKGDKVEQIQKALGVPADGIFGTGTENAVKKFQKEHGLTPDGIVGSKTLNAIMSEFDTDLSPIIKPVSSLDITEYYLPKKEYLNGTYKNDYIILHHTAGHDDPKQVVDSWAKDSLGRVATEFVLGGIRSTDCRNTNDGKLVRAFPEGNQAYHIGNCGSSYMSTHSVGIEMCNIGWVKAGKSYVNTIVKPDQIVTLKEPFRGYLNWHKYSDKQLQVLHDWLLYISKRDNIDLHRGIYEWIKREGAMKAFDFHQDAYDGKIKGVLTHANIRKDKFDLSPQPNLIDMILTL